MCTLRFVFGAVAITAIVGVTDAREWKDSTGEFAVEARLAEVSVSLEKPDGSCVRVSFARLSDGDKRFILTHLWATLNKPRTLTENQEITNSIGMKLKLIPAGEFLMGTNKTAIDRLLEAFPELKRKNVEDETPQHRVRLTNPFYLGVHEVTVGQFRRFVEDEGYETEAEREGKGAYAYVEGTWSLDPETNWRNPGFSQTQDHPVTCVSWNDAFAFCRWLSDREGVRYRLPTEAEWEYACRAGTTTDFHSGNDPEKLADVENVADLSAKKTLTFADWATISAPDGFTYTAPVGSLRANPFGLFDMHGNAGEWCSDWYAAEYYANSPRDDPQGPSEEGSYRVLRGGCWYFSARDCRSASRAVSPGLRFSFLGFRVARSPSGR